MIVEVLNVSKKFESTLALNDVSVSVEQGELFGFIGPDGAGKTTLFRILTTLLIPDAGIAKVLNLDVVKDYKQIRRKVGYMPGRFSLYQDLTVEENLQFFATIFGTTIEENYELVKGIYSQIEPFKKRKAGKLSGGMKQKLALSCALIHKPEVLFLDEPTTGVDPVSRNEFWEMLGYLKEQGITILVSTPYMDEASLCDRVALMQKGDIMTIDTPHNIVESFPKPLFALRAPDMYGLLLAMRKYEHTESINTFGEYLHYTDKRDNPGIEDIKNHLRESGFQNTEVKNIKPGIEDCFMELMEGKYAV
jgi:ABC-type multidrug transport system ATPase subunit